MAICISQSPLCVEENTHHHDVVQAEDQQFTVYLRLLVGRVLRNHIAESQQCSEGLFDGANLLNLDPVFQGWEAQCRSTKFRLPDML